MGLAGAGDTESSDDLLTGEIPPIVVLLAVAIVTAACGGAGSRNEPDAGPSGSTHSAGAAIGRSTKANATGHKARATKRLASRKVAAKPVDRVQQHGGRRAAVVLAALPVRGRASMAGYSREQFGPAWTVDNNDPLDHNGCDTRNDLARRDLTAEKPDPTTSGCVVETGVLRDPHMSRIIHLRRGETTSLAVQNERRKPRGG